MTKPFRLGFLTHVRGQDDPQRVYAETMEQFMVADQLGFDVGWVAQHHFKAKAGFLPSPFPFLAAVAQRTERIHLGTSIVVLPLEMPLRVAEDAAVVDLLSGGRLELGVGSGGDPDEFRAFGVDVGQRHPLTTSGLVALRAAFCGEQLGASGLTLQPPAPTLGDRMYLSALSVGGAHYAAQHGVGLMLSRAAWGHEEPTDKVQRPVADAFRTAWTQREIPPRIALSRGIYLANNKQAALDEMRTSIMTAVAGMVKQGRIAAGLSLARYCEHFHIAYGSPADAAAFLAADAVLPVAAELILQFDPVFPPLDRTLHMMEQIAREVAPALGWEPG